MTTAAFTLLRHASQNRERWLNNFYGVGKEAVRPRRAGELLGFKISSGGNQGLLLSVLDRAGVEYSRLSFQTLMTPQGRRNPLQGPGSDVFVGLAQPYGGFAKALLEKQGYPNLRDTAGNPISPYDVTAHTLPLLMGVRVSPVFRPVRTLKPLRSKLVDNSDAASGPTSTGGVPRLAI